MNGQVEVVKLLVEKFFVDPNSRNEVYIIFTMRIFHNSKLLRNVFHLYN